MERAPTCLLIVALASGWLARAQTPSQSNAPPTQPATVTAAQVCGGDQGYDELTAVEQKPPPPEIIPTGQSPIELTISAVEFSDKPVEASVASSPDFCWESTRRVGVNISASGQIYGFANGGEGSLGFGGGGKLAAEDFARVQSLMNSLPDDRHRVPPANRRVVVEVQRNSAATVRLYDSANLPDAIIEIIRLTGAPIKITAPSFHADRVVPAEEVRNPGRPVPWDPFLTISPDGLISVVHDFVTKTLTVYEGSTWPQNGGGPVGGEVIRVIPEFWQPPQYGGYAVSSEFSPDGHYLLVRWGRRIGALLFDTTTWEPVTDPRLFPQNLKEYLSAADWSSGIAVTDAGEALVWDQRSHRIVSKLPGLGEFEPAPVMRDQQGNRTYDIPNAEIQFASFSPDRTRVAIFSGPDNIFKLRLSIWDIETGKKEGDLWPLAPMTNLNGAPVWWNDGQWLLASFPDRETGVWDAKTGRLLGTLEFSNCNVRVDVVITGAKLRQTCFMGRGGKGKSLEWSVDEVRKQMESVERLVARGQ